MQPSLFWPSHAEQFDAFHTANPHIYNELVKLARQVRARGKDHVSIRLLFEVVRFNHLIRTTSTDDFKINNNHAPYYARLIMESEPDLRGFFALRGLRAA